MLQFGGLGLDGSIEISVSVIVTVSHLLGSSQGKFMVMVRLGLGFVIDPNNLLTPTQP